MSVLSFDGATVTARIGGRKVDALRDIAFDLHQGETIGLVGNPVRAKA